MFRPVCEKTAFAGEMSPQVSWRSLRWRATFIDVEDESTEMVRALRRSRSDPNLRIDCHEHACTFGDEMAYVDGLAGKRASLWGAAPGGGGKRHSSGSSTSSRGSSSGGGGGGNCSRSIGEDSTSVGTAESFLTTSDMKSFLDTSAVPVALTSCLGSLTSTTILPSLCDVHSAAQLGAEAQVSEAAAAELAMTMPSRLPKGLSTFELKNRIYSQTKKISKTLQSQQLREGLAAVEELAEQAEGVCSQPRLLEARGEKITQVVANQVVAQMLLQAKVSEQGRGDQHVPNVDVSIAGSNASANCAAKRSGTDGIMEAQAAPTAAVCNLGSIGHPNLCLRPCLYFAAGNCSNGDSCAFCHLGHPKRPAHLDKRHREMLREMPLQQSAALVLPVLRQKVMAADGSAETMALLAQFAEACGVPQALGGDGVQLPKPPREYRMLGATLKAMSLRLLLTSTGRVLTQGRPEVEAMTENLFQHLRRSASTSTAWPAVSEDISSVVSGR